MSTKRRTLHPCRALLIRYGDYHTSEDVLLVRKAPLSPTTTPFQANAMPSRTSRRPSVIKGTIYAHDGAFRSRYGAHPAIKGAFCHERVPFSHMAAPFQADTAPLPSAKAPFWYEKRSSRPWRCPSKQIRRPPAINGALLARTSALLLTTAPFEANTGRRASDKKRRPICL